MKRGVAVLELYQVEKVVGPGLLPVENPLVVELGVVVVVVFSAGKSRGRKPAF